MNDHPTPLGGTCISLVIIDVDRHITFAHVMNKMAPSGGAPIAAALGERVTDVVNREATCCPQRRSAP